MRLKKKPTQLGDSLLEYRKLGQILLERHAIDADILNNALGSQRANGSPLGTILLEQQVISEQQLAEAVALQKHLPVVNLSKEVIEPAACALITLKMAQDMAVLPISIDGEVVTVATADPLNISALDDLSVITGMRVRAVVVTATDLREAINSYLKHDDYLGELAQMATNQAGQQDIASENMVFSDDAPIVKLVSKIIVTALELEASDIHIEPREHDVRLRYRVDGVLRTERILPKRILSGMISRIKVMSSLDIAERRVPQDGRCRTKVEGRYVDLRVSTLPSTFGESVNMRVVDMAGHDLTLADIGMDEDMLMLFREESHHSHGCLLVTGPTGSGKTTTLYATLQTLNDTQRKIITIEDPVEQTIDGVVQIQIATKAGLTFATGLRSILRHDPDIVMVGEIRDLETAQVSIRSALTGHFVLSSLHTNDAPSAITRLVDMGVEPFLVASSVRGVLAQRLARKLCLHCREPYELDAKEFTGETLYRAKGCKKCGGTGYQGRVGIFELMTVNDDIAKLCVKRAASLEMRRVAINQGMITLRSDGMKKVRSGLTSLEEVMRVLS